MPRDASAVRSRVHGLARAGATERGAASDDAETGEAAAGSGLEAQVGEIDKELVRLGGVDCGWDALEHAAYMRLRTQLLGPAVEGKPCLALREPARILTSPVFSPSSAIA